MSNPERESRMWWAVCDWGIEYVKGWSCAPNNPDMWWCPKVGCSMSEGHHLFATQLEALDKCLAENLEKRRKLDELIAKLRREQEAL